MNTLSEEITDFLVGMGIPLSEQQPDYRLEIAYRMGYLHGVRNYAIWNDGQQYVGAMRRPLREVEAEFKNQSVPMRY